MRDQQENKKPVDMMAGAQEYAELLKESKRNEAFYKLLSVALASYADGVKSALRCQNVAQAAT